LKHTLIPRIDNFSNQVDDWVAQLANLHYVVKQFDVALNMKEGKQSFMILKKALEDKFIDIDMWCTM